MCVSCVNYDFACAGTSFATGYCKLSGKQVAERAESCKGYIKKPASAGTDRGNAESGG